MFANLIVVFVIAVFVCCVSASSLKEDFEVSKRAFLKREDYASVHDFHNAMLFNNHAQLAHEDIEIRMDEIAASSSGYVYATAYGSSTCTASTAYAKNLYAPMGNNIIMHYY